MTAVSTFPHPPLTSSSLSPPPHPTLATAVERRNDSAGPKSEQKAVCVTNSVCKETKGLRIEKEETDIDYIKVLVRQRYNG